jgi:hypothetical protein
MNCRTFREHHGTYLDGLVGEAQRAAMKRHMAECASCAAHDTAVRRALLVLRNLPPIEPSPEFNARLRTRLDAIAAEGVRPFPVRMPRWRLVGSASAIAAGLLVAVFAGGTARYKTAQSASPIALAPLVVAATPLVVASRPVVNIRDRLAGRHFVPAGPGDPADMAGAPVFESLGSPALAASMASGMPIWPAAALVARPPAAWGAPEMKLTNLQR